jgi:hypothetical protein
MPVLETVRAKCQCPKCKTYAVIKFHDCGCQIVVIINDSEAHSDCEKCTDFHTMYYRQALACDSPSENPDDSNTSDIGSRIAEKVLEKVLIGAAATLLTGHPWGAGI